MTVELLTDPKFFVVGQFFYNGEWDGENWITLTDIEFTINLLEIVFYIFFGWVIIITNRHGSLAHLDSLNHDATCLGVAFLEIGTLDAFDCSLDEGFTIGIFFDGFSSFLVDF